MTSLINSEKTIAFSVGHCKKDPGSLAGLFYEYPYNKAFAKYVLDYWESINFSSGYLLHTPNAADSNEAVKQRVEQAIENNTKLVVEIHQNEGYEEYDDYALTYYRRGDSFGQMVSDKLRNALTCPLKQYGIKRWLEIPLPNSKWHRSHLVMQTKFTGVILETAFVNSIHHNEFYKDYAMKKIAIRTAKTLKGIYDGLKTT